MNRFDHQPQSGRACPQKGRGREKTCQAAIRLLSISGYGFGPNLRGPSRSEVSGGCAKTVGDGLRLVVDDAGAGCRPVGSVANLPVNGRVSERGLGGLKRKKRSSDQRRRLGLNRGIGARNAPLEWRRAELRPGSWLTMSLSRDRSCPTPTSGRAVTIFGQRPSGAAKSSDSHFYFPSISNTDAARGVVERRAWPSAAAGARRKRVFHGKQDDHRRFSPGRNPGGGSAR